MSAPTRIGGASPFDQIKQTDETGAEFWSARDLSEAMEYDRWENFSAALERAKAGAGHAAVDHFRDAAKVIPGGRWGEQTVSDVHLTRYGAYLVMMNGDPRKPAVGAGQTYFAVKTREAETRPAVDLAAITRRDLALMLLEAEDERAAAVERAEVAEAQVVEVAPKVELAEKYLDSRPNGRLVRETAKTLGVKESWLRAFLLEEGLIFLRHATCGANIYDFKAEFRAHFEAREKIVDHNFGPCSHYTLTVTPRGVDLIRKRIAAARITGVA